jgi:thioredoxin-related protein
MKYKLIILSFFILLLNYKAKCQVSGLQFQDITYEQALLKSTSEKKPVFIFCFATWCHFCEYMKDSVLPTAAVGEFYNQNFICIKMDLEKEGKSLNQKTIRAKSFPVLLFMNSQGEMLHRVTGKKDAQDFIQIGKDALDSTKQLRTFVYKYRDGKLSPSQTYEYFKMVDRAGMDNQSLINNYLTLIPEDKLTATYSWKTMYELYKDIEQPCMKLILEHRSDYATKYTADSIDNKIIGLYINALMSKVQMLDSNGYLSIQEKLRASKLDLAEKIIAFADLNKMKMKGDWDGYFHNVDSFVVKYATNDYRRLNDVAYNIFEKAYDKDLLRRAEGWSLKAVSLMDTYKNNYTLACLYYRNEKYDEARVVLYHAIDQATKQGIDPKQALQLISRLPPPAKK